MGLEKIPSLIAVATFCALSLVVAQDWGYFGVIGIDFQSFFTTYDYISELLVSIGPAFVGLMALLAIQAAVFRHANFDTGGSALKSKWGKWFHNWNLELIWGFGFGLALLFSDETRRISLYILLSLLWLRIVSYVYGHTAFNAFKNSPAGLLVVALPALMIAMYGLGRDGAYADLKDTTDQYRLHAKNKEFSQSVKILRLLDKGAIVLDPETKLVEFHPREDIALLERDAPKWETKSFACRHWGWSCGQVSGSSK
jgi:energy-coupling factor transporter transmembrane protein EcfT